MLARGLNPLKQVKAFGPSIDEILKMGLPVSGLNPLKQVKAFGRTPELQAVLFHPFQGLNPLKQVKAFGQVEIVGFVPEGTSEVLIP